jgi:hypothetical protein
MYVDRPPAMRQYADSGEEPCRPPRFDPALEAEQAAWLATLRERRDDTAVGRALSALKSTAEGTENVLYPLRDALRAECTLGEVCDALRDVWGEYRPEKNLTSYQFRARRLKIGYRVESIPGRNPWRRMGSTAYRRQD